MQCGVRVRSTPDRPERVGDRAAPRSPHHRATTRCSTKPDGCTVRETEKSPQSWRGLDQPGFATALAPLAATAMEVDKWTSVDVHLQSTTRSEISEIRSRPTPVALNDQSERVFYRSQRGGTG